MSEVLQNVFKQRAKTVTVYPFIKYFLKPPFSKIVSEVFPIMPDEVREHSTTDPRPFLQPESHQILQISSSMTVLLLFSSPHSFSIGFRSEDWNFVLFLRFVFGLLHG